MSENETDVLMVSVSAVKETEMADTEMAAEMSETTEVPTITIPKPIFKRLLILFVGGAGCLFVGIVVSVATDDLVMLWLSAILGVSFIAKGFFLRSKIRKGLIFEVLGVCVSVAPKFFGRYRRIELVDVDNGGSAYFILPKKVVFKIGHVYTCYFDNPINNQPMVRNSDNGSKTPKGRFFNDGLDLPTNGFLGFEDFGVYQERPRSQATSGEKHNDKNKGKDKDNQNNNAS